MVDFVPSVKKFPIQISLSTLLGIITVHFSVFSVINTLGFTIIKMLPTTISPESLNQGSTRDRQLVFQETNNIQTNEVNGARAPK